MNEKKDSEVNHRLSIDIKSCSFDKTFLRKICDVLQERADAAAEYEITNYVRRNETDEEYEENINELRAGFVLNITIEDFNGKELSGTITEVFDSVNFPENVRSLYLNSKLRLKARYDYTPKNHFKLFIDFSKPSVFDFSLLPSRATPNESNFSIAGYDSTWAHGVFNEISNMIKEEQTRFEFIHKNAIYDVLLWFIGFPYCFWMCFKLSNLIEKYFNSLGGFVKNMVYFYIFIISIFVLRILFQYLRWTFPLMEYKSNKNKSLKHRIIIVALFLGLLTNFIWEAIKLIL